eukprot:g2206.t1
MINIKLQCFVFLLSFVFTFQVKGKELPLHEIVSTTLRSVPRVTTRDDGHGLPIAVYLKEHVKKFKESYLGDASDCGSITVINGAFSAWIEALEALPPNQVPTALDTVVLLDSIISSTRFKKCGPFHHMRGAILFHLKERKGAFFSFQRAAITAGPLNVENSFGYLENTGFMYNGSDPLEWKVPVQLINLAEIVQWCQSKCNKELDCIGFTRMINVDVGSSLYHRCWGKIAGSELVEDGRFVSFTKQREEKGQEVVTGEKRSWGGIPWNTGDAGVAKLRWLSLLEAGTCLLFGEMDRSLLFFRQSFLVKWYWRGSKQAISSKFVLEHISKLFVGINEDFKPLGIFRSQSKATQENVLRILKSIVNEATYEAVRATGNGGREIIASGWRSIREVSVYAMALGLGYSGKFDEAAKFLDDFLFLSQEDREKIGFPSPLPLPVNGSSNLSNDLRIIGVATKRTNGVENLLLSAAACGVKVNLLGLGEDYTGPYMKLRLYSDYLVNVPDDTTVLVLDAFDVLLFPSGMGRGGIELLRRYRAFNKRIVFGAETGAWPDPGLAPMYPNQVGRSPFRFLNSGGFIGRAANLKHAIQMSLQYDGCFDDQRCLTRVFLEFETQFALDRKASIFLNVRSVGGVFRMSGAMNSDGWETGQLLTSDLTVRGASARDIEMEIAPSMIHGHTSSGKTIIKKIAGMQRRVWEAPAVAQSKVMGDGGGLGDLVWTFNPPSPSEPLGLGSAGADDDWNEPSEEDLRFAYVTLLSSDDYLPGVLVLAQSLYDSASVLPLIVIIPDVNVSKHTVAILTSLASLGSWNVQVYHVTNIANPAHRQMRSRTVYNKIHVWSLTKFDIVCFIDADALIVENIDDIFVQAGAAKSDNILDSLLMAVPRYDWYQFLNSPDEGVKREKFLTAFLVIAPCEKVYKKLLTLVQSDATVLERFTTAESAASHARTLSSDLGDMGFLNRVFHDWPTNSDSKEAWLSIGYCAQAQSRHWIQDKIYVLEFSERPKPWHSKHRVGALEWWRIFHRVAAMIPKTTRRLFLDKLKRNALQFKSWEKQPGIIDVKLENLDVTKLSQSHKGLLLLAIANPGRIEAEPESEQKWRTQIGFDLISQMMPAITTVVPSLNITVVKTSVDFELESDFFTKALASWVGKETFDTMKEDQLIFFLLFNEHGDFCREIKFENQDEISFLKRFIKLCE